MKPGGLTEWLVKLGEDKPSPYHDRLLVPNQARDLTECLDTTTLMLIPGGKRL